MTLPVSYDRVKETTTTTGTGTLTLAGAVTGFQSFGVVGNGNTCFYCIEAVDTNGVPTGAWEVGQGTYTLSGTTLSRDTVLASSNSGSAVSLTAGTKNVFLTFPAERANPGNPSATIGLTAVNGTAATFMASDSAPPLGVAITPIWTGLHTFRQIGIATTLTDAIWVSNSTAATGSVKDQWSPSIKWTGESWNGSANRKISFRAQVQTANAGTPAGYWTLSGSFNLGAYSTVLQVDLSGNVLIASGAQIQFSTGALASVAVKSDQTTGTSATAAVVPGVQQYHTSACKAWAYNDGVADVLRANYNVTSVTDNGTGDFTFNFTTAFTTQYYGVCTGAGDTAFTLTTPSIQIRNDSSASALRVELLDRTGVSTDYPVICIQCFGAQ